MDIQAINKITFNLPKTPQVNANNEFQQNLRTSTPIAYTTLDGGLFIGYYLNVNG